MANWQKQNDPKVDTTKQNPFSPYAPYGRRKRRGVKSPRSRGQSCFMENNQTQRFTREGLVEKPCGKAHRQPVKEEKQTTQKSETRALYVPENRAENRAFGPKQRRNPHFIDKRKKAFYNQTVRGFRLPKRQTAGMLLLEILQEFGQRFVLFCAGVKDTVFAFCMRPVAGPFWGRC